MRSMIALYVANAREFFRSGSSVLFVLLLPIAFAAFFGVIFSGGDSFTLQLGLVNSVQTHPLRSIDLYIPALLGVAFLWLGLFGTAAPLVEQRESQLLRRLRVTTVTPAQMLAAQVGWRVTVGLMQTALFLVVGYLAFGVGVAGNVLLFAAAVALGALVFVSMGYLLAGLSRSSEGAAALGQMVNFPMMFLSGTFIPIGMMPDSLKPVAAAMPLTYLNDALRQVMVAAPAVNALSLDFAVLGGWLVVMLALAVKFWRWE